jgi:hypothetical protein
MSSKPIPQVEFDKMLSQSKDGLIFKYYNDILYVSKNKYCYHWKNGVFVETTKTQTLGDFWGSPTQALQNTSAYAVLENGNKPQTYALVCKALGMDNSAQVTPQPANRDSPKDLKKEVAKILANKEFQSLLNEYASMKHGFFLCDGNEQAYAKVTTAPGAIFLYCFEFNSKSMEGSAKNPPENILEKTEPSSILESLVNFYEWKSKGYVVPAVFGSSVAAANAVYSGKPSGLMFFLNSSLKAAGKPQVSMGSLTTLGAEADTASFWENHKNKFYIGGGIAMIVAVVGYGYKTFKDRK